MDLESCPSGAELAAFQHAGVWRDDRELRVAPPLLDGAVLASDDDGETDIAGGVGLSPSQGSVSSVDDDGAKLSSDSDEAPTGGTASLTTQRRPWQAGENCGSWVSSGSRLGAQGTVLLLNVLQNVRRLPPEVLGRVHSYLCRGRSSYGKWSLADSITAALCGVGVRLAPSRMRVVAEHGWDPAAQLAVGAPRPRPKPVADGEGCVLDRGEADAVGTPASAQGHGPLSRETSASQNLRAMSALVREALAGAVAGRPDSEFIRGISRLRLAGVDIGSKYHSRHFARSLEHLAGLAVTQLSVDALNLPLPALGIPSDMALIFDGVSIGATQFSRNETLLVVGVVSTSITTGACTARLLAAPSHGVSHSGQATVSLLLDTVGKSPFHMSTRNLRARLAVVGGDGAVVRGGEEARHSSSGAADLLWQRLHPNSELCAVVTTGSA